VPSRFDFGGAAREPVGSGARRAAENIAVRGLHRLRNLDAAARARDPNRLAPTMSIRTETSWRPGSSWRPSERKKRGFAGRGPRDYTRPDSRIREDVCDALTAHDAIDASDIEVTVLDGEVTLSGMVDDSVAKALAEATAGGCTGVRRVRSRLWLRQEERGSSRAASPSRAAD